MALTSHSDDLIKKLPRSGRWLSVQFWTWCRGHVAKPPDVPEPGLGTMSPVHSGLDLPSPEALVLKG